MVWSAVISLASARVPSTLVTFMLACFGAVTLVFIFSFFFDIKNQRRERAAGKEVFWYKRTTLYGSGGGLCLISAETLKILVANATLPGIPFFYILIPILIFCGLCLSVYSLKLARQQRKVALDQLKSMLDQRKSQ